MSRDVRAGGAFIELGVRSAIDKGLAQAQKKLTSWGKGLVATGGTIAAASAGLLTAPVMAAAESGEILAKFGTVFGDTADQMLADSNNMASALGVAESEMQGMLSGLQDLLVPMGVAPGKASEMSKTLSALAVDLGSFNNMATADVMTNLMAAMTGSGAVMKKYGVILDAAATKQELLNMGLDPATADQAAKAQARLNIIMRMTTAAQGDAVRTQNSFTNQMKRIRAETANFLGDAGAPLLETLAAILKRTTAVIKVTRGWMSENQGLVKVAVMGVAGLGALGGVIASIGLAAIVTGAAIGGIASALALLMSPLGVLMVGLGGLAAYFFSVFGSMGEMTSWFKDRFAGLSKGVSDSMVAIMEAISQGNFAEAWDLILEAMEMAWSDLTTEIHDTWMDTLKKLVDGAVWGAEAIGTVFTAMGSAIVKTLDFVSKQQNWVKNRATEAIASITGERIIGGDVFSGSALPPAADAAIRAAAAGISDFGERIQEGAAALGEETKMGLEQRKAERRGRMEELRAAMAGRADIIREAKEAAKGQVPGAAPELPGPETLAQAAGGGESGQTSTRGTFSSFGAFALGTRGITTQEKIEKNTDRTAKATEATAEEAKKQPGAVFA